MAKKYYTFPQTEYPPVTNAVLERIRLFFCTLLYPDEAYVESQKRFLLTDITSNRALHESMKILNLTNSTFPFTAYNIGDAEIDTDRENTFAKTKKYFSSTFSGKIHVAPLILELPMITFFSNSKDFDRARTILFEQYALVTKLTVPITVNGILDSFTITVSCEIKRGNYAYEFEQQLIQGNIYDLDHSCTITFHQIIWDGNINEVDDIEFSLAVLEDPPQPTPTYIEQSIPIPDTPVITSVPEDEETDVDVDTDITLSFNVAMNTDSVEDAFYIYPYINADYVWNSASTQVVVNILTPLVSGTSYSVEIDDTAESIEEIPIDGDFELTFATE